MSLAALDLQTRAAALVAQHHVEIERLCRLRRRLEASGTEEDVALIPAVDARIDEIQGWVQKLESSPAHVACTTFECSCRGM